MALIQKDINTRGWPCLLQTRKKEYKTLLWTIEGCQIKSLREVGVPSQLSGKHNRSVDNILRKQAWLQQRKHVRDSLLASCGQSSAQGANRQPKSLRWTPWCIPQRVTSHPPGTNSLTGNVGKQAGVPQDLPLGSFIPCCQIRGAPKTQALKRISSYKRDPLRRN